ncbi:PREDICTED: uncharacterized protein LOC109210960 [Nicotiana attenuata]|uniref:uncharacterized protein LOC109210960 n=1 Tax=Nicotiana attenuata TaxID=49451 RepID=UPI000905151C|nr:PREDICTED: uncharacterized protein LOC109210960 [Nicotiana attenuata]
MFQSIQGASASFFESSATANLVGIHHACFVFTSFLSKLTNVPWILDIGATQHMTFDKSLLHGIRALTFPLLVNLANSSKAPSLRKDQLVGKATADLYVLKDNTSSFCNKPQAPVSISSCNMSKSLLKSFLALVERQFLAKVKVIRSGNAYELGTGQEQRDFFFSQGIIHQTTCVGTPQQNGVVERKHRHLLETCRALMFQSHAPKRYWGESLLTATYLINRFSSQVLRNKSPYRVLFGKDPDCSYLKPFGCLCFNSTLSRNRDKLSPRAFPGIFLGYPFGKKGYKILNLEDNTICISRNVKFIEFVFPFSSPSPLSKLFPSCFPSTNDHFFSSSSSTVLSPNLSLQSTPLSKSASKSKSLPSKSSPLSPIYDPIVGSAPRTEVLPTAPEEQLRRSQREHHPPKYLSDYVCNFAFSVISPNPPFLSLLSFYFFCYDTPKSMHHQFYLPNK